MLKDRRVLLEHELKIAQDQAAHLYLEIVTNSQDVHNETYYKLRDKVNQLQFDLDLVNRLIDKGQP